ncbi:uncharacterized protein METZ01_LOCUS394600 [marine metagenome]|uniref:Uncharacterized protein n=1 Tax=marine metagenome TaxID=408172 RepID=A0A382V5A3_9ZZZZ
MGRRRSHDRRHPDYAGGDTVGNGQLNVTSKMGTNLIYAGADTDDTWFFFGGYKQDW